MFGFLLVLLLLVGLFMSVVVLLQSGKGGGLAAMGGGSGGTAADNLIGGRQAATLLTRATWVSGGLFLALSLTLSVLSSRQAGPASVLEGQFQPAPTAPQPVLPGAQPQGDAGVNPLTPVEPATGDVPPQDDATPPQP